MVQRVLLFRTDSGGRLRRSAAPLLLALFCLFALFLSASASAAVVRDRPLLFSFDGADTTAGKFGEVAAVAVDQSSGTVYVADKGKNVLDKFNLVGTAQDFTTTGASSLAPGFSSTVVSQLSGVAVDSHGPNAGRVYLLRRFGPITAFSPAGSFLWGLEDFGSGSGVSGIAVDAAGDLWAADETKQSLREFAPSGSPPAEIGSIDVAPEYPKQLAVDAAGNFIVRTSKVVKYEGGVKGSTIDSAFTTALTVDQSSAAGHLFTLHFGNFNEYDAAGVLIGTFGTDQIGSGKGLAYDEAADRVYVADSGSDKVEVFGPLTEGTAPDVTIEAPTAVGISKAEFHGKADPLGLAEATYRFEWKQGTGTSWQGAQTSAPVALPTTAGEVATPQIVNSLRGGTTYQVRLVGTNEENGLKSFSSPETFTTAAATAAPTVTIAAPGAVTATSAKITGTLNPDGDTADWRVQTSTDPLCASGFEDEPTQAVAEGSETAVGVEFDLTELLPSQHYCARISAENSFGPASSGIEEFTTSPVPPSELSTAFAAPRADTSARVNGRVNPRGASVTHPLTYHFEYSKDGGATWIALPDHEYSGGARRQVVLGEELTGLQPSTAYEYRFAAESEAGPASPQGAPRSFTTRSQAAMALRDRGIELVNTPSKGNQNVSQANPFIEIARNSTDQVASSDRAYWKVFAGAPGASIAANNLFVARRTPEGWRSESTIPPGPEQVGGADLLFLPVAAAADGDRFVFVSFEAALADSTTLVTRGNYSHQETLYSVRQEDAQGIVNSGVTATGAAATTDLSHVLFVSPQDEQVVDVGSGSPEVISLMPDGSAPSCGVNKATGFYFSGGDRAYPWIDTDDASIVFFRSKGDECSGPERLWVRDRDAETTEELGPEAQFIRATPDGTAALFWSPKALVGEDENADPDLYVWRRGEGLECATCVVADADVAYPGELAADDLSRIYFPSPRRLTPDAAPGENTYVLHDDAIHRAPIPLPDEMQATADARVLLFLAGAGEGLTSDSIAPACEHRNRFATTFGECQEVYRYDDGDGSVECVSCRQGGTTDGDVGPFELYLAAHLSGDGDTVAFITETALARDDVNRSPDVYVWHNGAVGMVTDGETERPVGVALPVVQGVDAHGDNIFFSAGQVSTGFEQDGLSNLYDARVGGGFAAPTAPAHCDGDSCQGPLRAAPGVVQGASAGFHGRGNVASAAKRRCGKGKVRRGGRCAKRRCGKRKVRRRGRCVQRRRHRTRRHRRHRHDKHDGHGRKARAHRDAGRAK